MNYSEKLKDPRWQKKRLEIFQRDNFQCQLCASKDKTLIVHHKSYLKNIEPWDYDNELLVTYCEDCHEGTHLQKDEIIDDLIYYINKSKLCFYDIRMITKLIYRKIEVPNFFWKDYVYGDKEMPSDLFELWIKASLKIE